MKIYYKNSCISFSATGLVEEDFITRVVESFEQEQVPGTKPFTYWFVNGYEPEPTEVNLIDGRSIVFINDERRIAYPEIVARAKAVFQSFIGEDELLGPNHFCFPLGHNKSFCLQPYKRIAERKVNVFFSGNLHLGRKGFYHWLAGFRLPFFLQHRVQKLLKLKFDHRFPDSYIRFTSGFNTGLPGAAYSDMIADTKIVLCPGGIISVESFRYYEAMMQGCIVLTEPMPYRHLLKDSPAIIIEDWREAGPIIRELIARPEKMEKLSEQAVQWYRDCVSPAALGRYMHQQIGG